MSTPVAVSAFGSSLAAETPGAVAPIDLGPLAWVFDEVRKSIDGAVKVLHRQVRDGGVPHEADLTALRGARQNLHHAVGALEMVGQPGAARVLGAVEFAAQQLVEQPERLTDEGAQRIERAGFALVDFLQARLAGKTASPVALFVQYREVLEFAGNDRMHPADLWGRSWRWADVPVPPSRRSLVYDPAVRAKFDRELLRLVRLGNRTAARELHDLCNGLAQGAAEPSAQSFWSLASAFFEALALELIEIDAYVKRAALRVLLQYMAMARGELAASELLAHDLLFFCAQAAPEQGDAAPSLRATRAAWDIAEAQPIDYTRAHFGRFDPQLLVAARKRIEATKEAWSTLAGGDGRQAGKAAEAAALLYESLQGIHPQSLSMVRALQQAIDVSKRSNQPPSAELSMEVATSVLYLEAAFEDLDPSDEQLAARTAQLAGRIERVRAGGQSEPLEPWMEELYRRVSDRQTIGTVVGELRGYLSELEKSLDRFFRRAGDTSLLTTVPAQLMQMRGVFALLGLDQAARTVTTMRAKVESLMIGDPSAAPGPAFEMLGHNLGALGFLVDMLGYQPTLAKRLFVFDEAQGELKPLMGRQADLGDAGAGRSPLRRSGGSAADRALPGGAASQVPAAAPESEVAPPPAEEPFDAAASIEEFSRATESWSAKIAGPTPLESLPDTEVVELGEDDLQGIFLTEAREVLLSAMSAVQALARDASDASHLTVLRRAFHTLKGSSRMVGLGAFGDASWSLEQLLNTWLADQKPATPGFLAVTGKALTDLGRWVQAIAAGKADAWQALPFQRARRRLAHGRPQTRAGTPA